MTKGRKAFDFYGIGRTGKSTLLNILEAVVGGGLVSHEPFHTMSGERAKAHYLGMRMNISRETSNRPNRNEESFKRSLQMNKLNTFAAVLKFITGRNYGADSLKGICSYITDETKTNGGKLIATQGCSSEHPVDDMLTNKRLHNKTHGKQYEHFVLAPCTNGSDQSPEDILRATKEIVATVFPENMAVITVHTDTKVVHAHTVLDAVNAVTGRKFSQSPADLNRVKQKSNNILEKHGFEIITASANDIVDHTDYSNEVGFDFLELDESQFLTEIAMPEVSGYIADSGFDDVYNTLRLRANISKYLIGGTTMNNKNQCAADTQTIREQAAPTSDFRGASMSIYAPASPQAQPFANQKPVPEVLPQAVPANNGFVPAMQQPQRYSMPTATADCVSAQVETTINSYPNTNVVTGPTFRIKGTPESNLAGLNELVSETSAYTKEHQPEAAKLALAMQQYGQQTGFPSNVAVYAGPIFDIDLTGGMFPPMPGYGNDKY
ncbi:MAG: relaxase/mobilization nuclease domain-containing protein [Ruminococcus sp.]|nr:relaxase/mobilization nuclease domain-containing protein [Ruminococcus sp.]